MSWSAGSRWRKRDEPRPKERESHIFRSDVGITGPVRIPPYGGRRQEEAIKPEKEKRTPFRVIPTAFESNRRRH